jgi:nucleoside 2-deoxyribosyltransferase
MRVVYVAGPFRATNANGRSNAWGVQQNVMAAMALALEVWKRGCVGLCPHANTMFFQDADGCADRVWLDGDLELLRRCDALITTPDWERSSGARKEVEFAKAKGIAVLHSVEELDDWLNETRRLRGCEHEETSVCVHCM